jgi:hypothetical protein
MSRLHVGEAVPSWLVGLTVLAFIAGVTALAASCPTAARLEDWTAHYDRVRSRRLHG